MLFYPITKERTGKRGRPFVYDGKIDFNNLDLSRCEQIDIDKGRLFSLKAYSKPLKKTIKSLSGILMTEVPSGSCISLQMPICSERMY